MESTLAFDISQIKEQVNSFFDCYEDLQELRYDLKLIHLEADLMRDLCADIQIKDCSTLTK